MHPPFHYHKQARRESASKLRARSGPAALARPRTDSCPDPKCHYADSIETRARRFPATGAAQGRVIGPPLAHTPRAESFDSLTFTRDGEALRGGVPGAECGRIRPMIHLSPFCVHDGCRGQRRLPVRYPPCRPQHNRTLAAFPATRIHDAAELGREAFGSSRSTDLRPPHEPRIRPEARTSRASIYASDRVRRPTLDPRLSEASGGGSATSCRARPGKRRLRSIPPIQPEGPSTRPSRPCAPALRPVASPSRREGC